MSAADVAYLLAVIVGWWAFAAAYRQASLMERGYRPRSMRRREGGR